MDWHSLFVEHWQVKLVSVILIVAAYIDGKQLRVPNWITFPMVLAGVAFHGVSAGWSGLEFSVGGLCVGLLCLLPLYSVGGMGAGDVKLMAGIGAWLGVSVTWQAFCVSVVVGAAMAVMMVLARRSWRHHYTNFLQIAAELLTIRDPRELSAIAAERKPRMLLLPYGIPICIGSIGYFVYTGMI
ncbi:MAG: prepilin peptidase [Planctomycetales bacterium]|nr:prepilin peptidase [Planctomycetales bacterium]